MAEYNVDRSNSIIDVSLTELAFILFFILLIAAFWQIREANDELEKSREEIEELSDNLAIANKFFYNAESDPDEIFQELKLAEERKQRLQELEGSISSLLKDGSTLEDVKDKLTQFDEVSETLGELFEDDNVIEPLKEVMTANEALNESNKALELEVLNTKGQNANLREKVKLLGNGLDHPPCWADPVTGKIQYLYNVVISENGVEVLKGWPSSRDEQATNDNVILSGIGAYDSNNAMWGKTSKIFNWSVKNECRHYVRIYDHAESKKSFKNYLLGVENHFYKFLSSRRFNEESRG